MHVPVAAGNEAHYQSDSTALNCRGYSNNVLTAVEYGEKMDVTRRHMVITVRESFCPIWSARLMRNTKGDQVVGNAKVKKLFGNNYPRLQKIKAKYDPELVFGKWFPYSACVTKCIQTWPDLTVPASRHDHLWNARSSLTVSFTLAGRLIRLHIRRHSAPLTFAFRILIRTPNEKSVSFTSDVRMHCPHIRRQI